MLGRRYRSSATPRHLLCHFNCLLKLAVDRMQIFQQHFRVGRNFDIELPNPLVGLS
jgi:hypothetical protein